MTKLQQLTALLQSFASTPGQPEANSLAWSIQDLIDERIKAREDALRTGPPPRPTDALKPRAVGKSPLLAADHTGKLVGLYGVAAKRVLDECSSCFGYGTVEMSGGSRRECELCGGCGF
jgi:hypothetical protein